MGRMGGIMPKIDFTQFTKFAKEFEKLAKEDMPKFNEKAVKELAARLLAKVKERTPVYSKIPGDINAQTGGKLRKGWTIEKVEREGNFYNVEVINPVHYAEYVEKGHRGVYVPEVGVTLHLDTRWTEGVFMLKISEEELERDAERILENKLEEFMRDKFKGFS